MITPDFAKNKMNTIVSKCIENDCFGAFKVSGKKRIQLDNNEFVRVYKNKAIGEYVETMFFKLELTNLLAMDESHPLEFHIKYKAVAFDQATRISYL